MKLSENFSLRELTKSQTAARKGIDNTPSDKAVYNLTMLAQHVLQPVRDNFGTTNVSSGFRCQKLNTAVNGSKYSQHMKGEAADFECPAVNNETLYFWIRDNLDFNQLILEYYTPGDPNSGWIHCSYREGNNRREAFSIDGDDE